MFGFVIFGAKILYEKCSRKTLMKLKAERFMDSGKLNLLMDLRLKPIYTTAPAASKNHA